MKVRRLNYGLVAASVGLAVFILYGCSGEGPRPRAEILSVIGEGNTGIRTRGSAEGPTRVDNLGGNRYRLTILNQILEVLSPITPQVGRPLLIIEEGSSPLAFGGIQTAEPTVEFEQEGRRVQAPVNEAGVLRTNVALGMGRACTIGRNVTIVDTSGRRLTGDQIRFCFLVERVGATVRSTLPQFVRYRLPTVGQLIEDVLVQVQVDEAFRGRVRGDLTVRHANGTIEITDRPIESGGIVTFASRAAGAVLGQVSEVEINLSEP
ncbi:MAG: hypothetical protein RMK62_01810 [Armatimonadota bacterium]|nr:hypothetical protein [Armatimonadota bacterium]